MNWNIVIEYIQPGLLILVVFLICVGMFLKTTNLLKSDWKIPFILWGLGVVIVVLWFGVVDGKGFTSVIFVTGIVQGTLAAALAVFGHQVFKQASNKN